MTTKKYRREHRKRVFAGSKPSSFYGEGYYLRGEGSNYGRTDGAGNLVFSPYDEASYLPRNRQLAKFVVDTYGPKTALVLGCARAYLVQALRELGVDAKGIDISQWAIDNAPEKVKEHLFVGDICDLSRFRTASFDVVTAFDVFEHIQVPDLYTAIKEASRVCKKAMIIDVPLGMDDSYPDQSSGTDKSHVSVYSEGFWLKQFTNYIEKGIGYSGHDFRLEGKDVYRYPDGSTGGTFIFRKTCSLAERQTPAQKPKEENKPVDIILLNYNGLKFTPKCVETLYRNTDYKIRVPHVPTAEELAAGGEIAEFDEQPSFNLIVVDNQSTDGSAEWLSFAAQSYPNMKVCFLQELNKGFAEGINIGLAVSKAPYVLLLNNDTLFLQRDWLSKLVEALEQDASNGLVSPKLLYPDGRIQYAGASFGPDMQPYHIGRFKNAQGFSRLREVPWATFACVLARREALAGGLDERFLLGTFEDVDLCCRARFEGWRILFVPASVVYHYEGACTFTVNKIHFKHQQVANANLFYERWREWLRLNRNAYPEVYAE